MRQKLNENKTAQLALVAVLILAVGFFFMSGKKGSSSSTSAAPAAPTSAAAPAAAATGGATTDPSASLTATTTSVPAPPLPAPLVAAHKRGDTVVLLVVKSGGIDDRITVQAASALLGEPGVALFVVPLENIAHYAAITQGVGVDRTPALIVVDGGDSSSTPASVQYGFQTPESVVQAVRDARYHGPTLGYAPN